VKTRVSTVLCRVYKHERSCTSHLCSRGGPAGCCGRLPSHDSPIQIDMQSQYVAMRPARGSDLQIRENAQRHAPHSKMADLASSGAREEGGRRSRHAGRHRRQPYSPPRRPTAKKPGIEGRWSRLNTLSPHAAAAVQTRHENEHWAATASHRTLAAHAPTKWHLLLPRRPRCRRPSQPRGGPCR